MGAPLLMDYYTIHDYDENRIGFAPHDNSKKTRLEIAEAPPKYTLDGGERPGEAVFNAEPINYPVPNHTGGPAPLWATLT